MAEGKRSSVGKSKSKRVGAKGAKARVEPKPARARAIAPGKAPPRVAPVIAKRPEYVKLGELLVRGGLLSDEQRHEIVEAGDPGRHRDAEPGGLALPFAQQPPGLPRVQIGAASTRRTAQRRTDHPAWIRTWTACSPERRSGPPHS